MKHRFKGTGMINYRNMKANKLVREDAELFEYMKTHYQSDNEREFFEKLRYKQENVLTVSNDLILSERNNEDRLYVVSVYLRSTSSVSNMSPRSSTSCACTMH